MSVRWLLTTLSFFFFMTVSIGCNEKQVIQNAWKGLAMSATTYNTVMASVAKLHKDGKVSDQTKDKFIASGKIFTVSYNTAVDALGAYDKVVASGSDSTTSKKVFDAAVIVLKDNLFSIIDDYNTVAEGIAGLTKIEKPGV